MSLEGLSGSKGQVYVYFSCVVLYSFNCVECGEVCAIVP
jgi:hypothetical protein